MQFTAACLQTNVQDDISANIRAIDALIDEAVGAGADFILLPENTFVMEAPGQPPKNPDFSEDNHPGIAYAKDKAKIIGKWLMLGSVAVKEAGEEKRRNRLLLLSDKGEVAARYDKIHLFDVTLPGGETYAESARMQAGDAAVMAQTPWGKLGLSICYDVRFPHLYRGLAQAGAQMLTVPAAFTHTTGSAHWEVLLRARAIENGCFVLAPAQCGVHPGKRRTWGHAMMIDPWGKVLSEASEDTPQVVSAKVDLSYVIETRQKIPSLMHGRPIVL